MSDPGAAEPSAPKPGRLDPHEGAVRSKRLRKRHRAERRYRIYGAAAIALALVTLGVLLLTVGWQGHGVFWQHRIILDIRFDPQRLGLDAPRSRERLAAANYRGIVRSALLERFPEVSGRRQKRSLQVLLSEGAIYDLRGRILRDPALIGTRQAIGLGASAEADRYFKGEVSRAVDEADRILTDQQLDWLDSLRESGAVERVFNWSFLTSGDSREPELAGVGGALVGTCLTLLVTLLSCFPIGVAAAVHLEEFAPKNRWTDLVEVNINNLAAVPSIVFGLLGLAVFLGFFGMSRSAPIVGGMVLALRTLPIIIIVSRAALSAVPPSIREAALGLGASRLQLVAHHLLPLALPGILTGTIIGMAQALGETAPLLMVGMVAFVADIPSGLQSPATVLPVQILLWSDAPERAFEEKTAGAIIILLLFLLTLNAAAVLLRHRFERGGS
jgi:phosphate transport system permease protein